ncbi:glycoside hydrolase family 95 protein [Sulfuriroseicoccus oceanibius]|uniref:Glycoside hydrolase family 95 protein n=1 Tax=Sulfuriroseicoccus oceanibius TaxID=2707525 RepID=A0A6B3LAY5_9BACT|nr:glycoside hydrolase family 95 protein [Sulfuriroseicoccus oceanibius]QQL44047.1 glycoside hydrolase family 95 protein [Sulfuriroseicoccus oceanibius]
MRSSATTLTAGLLLANLTMATQESTILWHNKPAEVWERDTFPIGNGALGATIFGAPDRAVMQFNVDSLWTGDENPNGAYTWAEEQPGTGCFGAYQNFGSLVFSAAEPAPEVTDYRRQLDIARAIHTTTWSSGGTNFTREAIASHPHQVIVWRISASRPGQISGTFSFEGAHPGDNETTTAVSNDTIALTGSLPNGLEYAAHAKIIPSGGHVTRDGTSIHARDCDELLVLLAADTNYTMDAGKSWRDGTATARVKPRIATAASLSWQQLQTAHEMDYRSYFERVRLDLGSSPDDVRSLPLNERIARYRSDAKDLPRPSLDPDLEEMLFHYGRYLLISSSRPGTLPANLQGIWNNSNQPAWHADYHSNINLQMCYWLAETSNLPEMAQPLFDLLISGAPVYRKDTAAAYGADTRGFVTRMSINPFGGGGWNWNIEGTAWLSQHFWEHYQFSRDERFLRQRAWPWMRDVSLFWLDRLKPLPDGQLVVPDAWSHEHGPHEDGTAHAQQLMWDLFTSTLQAAEILGEDDALQQRLKTTLAKLYGPKIGSWGQLMEWMNEKPDLEKGHHRHTSHLFAVYPGVQISMSKTPELAEAARISLTQRGEVGDSRRSWTWAWRTALWSRLGESERAHGCVAGLLAHNTLDNLWTSHPPFQIDGNLGITAGMTEMFVQSHGSEIALLPALPSAYLTGSVHGLRARGNIIIDIEWTNGNLTAAKLTSPIAQTIQLRLPNQSAPRTIDLPANTPVTLTF